MKNFVTIRNPVRIASVTFRMHKETQAVSTSSKSIRIGLCYKDGLALIKVILRSRAGWRRNVGPRQPGSGRIDINFSGGQEKTARERVGRPQRVARHVDHSDTDVLLSPVSWCVADTCDALSGA